MEYTLFEILIVIFITGITLAFFFYFNISEYIFPIQKDYGNDTLNALYSGSEGRVKFLENHTVIRIFSLENKNPSSVQPNDADIEIVAIAYYNTTVKIMAKNSYFGQNFLWDVISPYDFAFRWGELAKSEYDNSLNLINYKGLQRTAYFTLRENETELYQKYRGYQTNTHLIILDENIKNMVDEINVKDIVHFEGYLVDISFKSKSGETGTWNSDTDITNAGIDLLSACEIFYVTKIIL